MDTLRCSALGKETFTRSAVRHGNSVQLIFFNCFGTPQHEARLSLITERENANEGNSYRIGGAVAVYGCHSGIRSGWPPARQRLASSPPPFWCYGRHRPVVCSQSLFREGHEDPSQWQNGDPSRSYLRLSLRSTTDGEGAPSLPGPFLMRWHTRISEACSG